MTGAAVLKAYEHGSLAEIVRSRERGQWYTWAMANDDADRQRIIDRANRMLRQSRTLRKMSEALQKESRDLAHESTDLRKLAHVKGKGATGRKRR